MTNFPHAHYTHRVWIWTPRAAVMDVLGDDDPLYEYFSGVFRVDEDNPEQFRRVFVGETAELAGGAEVPVELLTDEQIIEGRVFCVTAGNKWVRAWRTACA
jgi:hypothetical protein